MDLKSMCSWTDLISNWQGCPYFFEVVTKKNGKRRKCMSIKCKTGKKVTFVQVILKTLFRYESSQQFSVRLETGALLLARFVYRVWIKCWFLSFLDISRPCIKRINWVELLQMSEIVFDLWSCVNWCSFNYQLLLKNNLIPKKMW